MFHGSLGSQATRDSSKRPVICVDASYRLIRFNKKSFAAYFNNKKLMSSLVREWERALPVIFYYDHLYEDQQKEITKAINEFYFNNEPLSESNQDNLTTVSKWNAEGMR